MSILAKSGDIYEEINEGMTQDVMNCWEEFWKPLCIDEKGIINLDVIKKELCDYKFLLEQVLIVYSYVTHGRLSKTGYMAETVNQVADEAYEELYKNVYKDDIMDIINGCGTDSEKLEEILNYISENKCV